MAARAARKAADFIALAVDSSQWDVNPEELWMLLQPLIYRGYYRNGLIRSTVLRRSGPPVEEYHNSGVDPSIGSG